jgi:hypothetical protein
MVGIDSNLDHIIAYGRSLTAAGFDLFLSSDPLRTDLVSFFGLS